MVLFLILYIFLNETDMRRADREGAVPALPIGTKVFASDWPMTMLATGLDDDQKSRRIPNLKDAVFPGNLQPRHAAMRAALLRNLSRVGVVERPSDPV